MLSLFVREFRGVRLRQPQIPSFSAWFSWLTASSSSAGAAYCPDEEGLISVISWNTIHNWNMVCCASRRPARFISYSFLLEGIVGSSRTWVMPSVPSQEDTHIYIYIYIYICLSLYISLSVSIYIYIYI